MSSLMNRVLFSFERQFESLESVLRLRRDTVNFVERELRFLIIFLKLQSVTNEPPMLYVTQKAQSICRDAALFSFSSFYTFMVKKKIRLIKREIIAKYSFPNISSVGINVREFIDTVVSNIRDLVTNDPGTKKYFEDVLKELKLLQTLVCFVSERFREPPSFFLAHVLAMAGHASMVAWLYFSGGGQHQALGEISALVFLKTKFQLIQPRMYIALLLDLKSQGWYCPNIRNDYEHSANFLEVIQHHFLKLPATSSSNSSQRLVLTDQLEILREVLNFFRYGINRMSVQDLVPLLRDIDAVIIDAALLVYSLYIDKDEEKEVNATQLVDLSATIIPTMIKFIRDQIQRNLPRIHGLGYVDFLLSNLEELQRRCAYSPAVENHLQIIHKELQSLQPFLKVVSQEPLNDLAR